MTMQMGNPVWGDPGDTSIPTYKIIIDGTDVGLNKVEHTVEGSRDGHLIPIDIARSSNAGFEQEFYYIEDRFYVEGEETWYQEQEKTIKPKSGSPYQRTYLLIDDIEKPKNLVSYNNTTQNSDFSSLIDLTSNKQDFVFVLPGDGTGDDTVNAGQGDDIVFGREGNDNLRGGEGNDALIGGKGNDSVYGDNGDDYLDGGIGNDALIGGEGNDSLYGSEGDDDLQGLRGNDSILGEAGNDRLRGSAGDDTLDGGAGNDRFAGYTGNDSLIGGAGNDLFEGGSGNDTLLGDDGSDRLRGGDGNDDLTGGSGADTFLFRSSSEGIDIINDFQSNEGDRIQILTSGFGASDTGEFSYDSSTGALSFGATHFATLSSGIDFDAGRDIVLI